MAGISNRPPASTGEGILATSPEQGAQLTEKGYAKCVNPLCMYFNSPRVMQEYDRLADDVEAGAANSTELWHTCPHCGHYYNIVAQPGQKGQKKLAPGGTTHSGLDPAEQGQIGEDIVKKLGQGDFAGYGPVLWIHHGGANSNSALDGMLQNWGIEVKTIDWRAENHRFIVKDTDAAKKNAAAQDPRLFAEQIDDPKLNEALDKLDVKGVLGVLVIIDLEGSLADVFVREFPYGQWGTNQFGKPIKGVRHFRTTAAIKAFGNVPFDNPLPDPQAEGFVPYHQRQQPTDFGAFSNVREAVDVGDAYPAQELDKSEEIENRFSPNEWDLGPTEYKFFYASGELEVSPDHSHEELRDHTGVSGDHAGPVAVGHVTVDKGNATWEINTNIGISAFSRILRDYTDQVGWTWGGLTDVDGEPVSDEFAPKRSVYWSYGPEEDHLALSYDQNHIQFDSDHLYGQVVKQGSMLYNPPVDFRVQSALEEWARDENLKLAEYPGGGNANDRLKAMPSEDLELDNLGTIDPIIDHGHDKDREPSGTFRCPNCSRLFPSWHTYMKHRRAEEPMGDTEPAQDGGFPEIEENAIQDSHTTPMQPELFPVAYVIGKTALQQQHPKDFIEDAVPFIYDIQNDTIDTGAPGARHSDIEGKFTPGGIVEGTYEPGGKVYIRSMTNMPYTVRHMIDLWYWQHPEFEIKNVTLKDDAGNETKLANQIIEGSNGSTYDEGHPLYDIAQRHPYVDLFASQRPGGIKLNMIQVAPEHQGKGYASTAFSDLLGYADGQSLPVALTPGIPEGRKGLSQNALNNWYRAQGFVSNKGHNKDYAFAESMIRPTPKTSKRSTIDEGQTIKALAAADPAVKKAWDALKGAGGKTYVVGGAVRDMLLGKDPKDIDLMVQGIPSQGVRRALEALPGRVDLTGKDFGVYRYRHAGHEVEIALPRRERSTGDAHTDFDVQADHTMDVEEDLTRRDFTANAIAVDLDDGEVIDPFDGEKDIKQGVLRTTNPKAFEEDPLRVARALVSYARHGLTPDAKTKAEMGAASKGLNHLPAERIQAELDKILGSKAPGDAIRLAHETGVLGHILPEVEQAWDFDQKNPHHDYSLGEHLVQVLERTAQQTDDPDVRLAALLHDVGKPDSQWIEDNGVAHYYENEKGQGKNHEDHGAYLAEKRMQGLRYPTNRTDRVKSLVEKHMYPDFSSPGGARKFLNKHEPHADDLLTLRDADRDGKGTPEYQDKKTPVDTQRALVDEARSTQAPTALSQLAINGHDLMNAGLQPGPQLGATLNRLVDLVVEKPELNTKEQLLELALG